MKGETVNLQLKLMPKDLKDQLYRDLERWKDQQDFNCRISEVRADAFENAAGCIRKSTSIASVKTVIEGVLKTLRERAETDRAQFMSRWNDYVAVCEVWLQQYFDCRDYQI